CGQAPLALTKEQAKERLQHIDPIRIGSGGYSEPDGSADKETNHPIRAIRYDMRVFLFSASGSTSNWQNLPRTS
ncbi:MAG: hypothetical protein QGH82_04260, partial [Candidatus Woesearchaeota archaeon]|nr:hypothetical protein [Candidatus Woesearchaeota archaeon]